MSIDASSYRQPEYPTPTSGAAANIRVDALAHGVGLRWFDFRTEQAHAGQAVGPATFCIAVYLDGAGRVALEHGPPLEIRPSTTVMFYAPSPSRATKEIEAGRRVRCLDFRFAPEVLTALGVPSPEALSRAFTQDCRAGDTLLFARPTPKRIAALAQDVLACSLEGLARQIFLHAKALEVLAELLRLGSAKAPVESKLDHLRIDAARALLSERFPESWTIRSLARTVGLNEKKLKAGFREHVGATVHGYLEETRLSAAAAMLQEGDAVTVVALEVGYGSPSHFAKVFRRRYGAAPLAWAQAARRGRRA